MNSEVVILDALIALSTLLSSTQVRFKAHAIGANRCSKGPPVFFEMYGHRCRSLPIPFARLRSFHEDRSHNPAHTPRQTEKAVQDLFRRSHHPTAQRCLIGPPWTKSATLTLWAIERLQSVKREAWRGNQQMKEFMEDMR